MEETQLLMYVQSTIRNIALYTATSFAALGYSRYYREKNQTYNILLIIVSILFSMAAYLIADYLLKDIFMFKDETYQQINKWSVIPTYSRIISITITLLALYTLFRQLMKLRA